MLDQQDRMTPERRIILEEMVSRGLTLPVPATKLDFPDWLPVVSPAWSWRWKYQLRLYEYLDNFTRGTIDRLLISMPPRHCKSETVTVRYTAWRLERDPTLPVIAGAYNQTLAERFSRKIRRVVTGRVPLSLDCRSVENWETAAGGGVRAAGVGGGVTGIGGRLIMLDDPVKSREEADSAAYRERVWDWYCDDIYTRLEPGGQICLIMTRWHDDDLAGRLLAAMAAGGDKWTVINFPAIAEDDDPLGRRIGEALCPERYPIEVLQRTKQVLGTGFDALYQGRPSPAGGGTFKRHWWRFWYDPYMPPPAPITVRMEDGTLRECEQVPRPDDEDFDGIAQSWDCAFKGNSDSDRVAGGAWGWIGALNYLLDQKCQRLDFPDTLQAVRDLTADYPDTEVLLVEDKANGPAVVAVLRKEIAGVLAINPEGGKESRANAVAPMVQAGQVYLPHPRQHAWVQDYIDELAAFPAGAHDDQVDQTSQFLLRRKAAEWDSSEIAETLEEREEREFRERVKERGGEVEEEFHPGW